MTDDALLNESSIRTELAALWAAHAAVGLCGKMSLYTLAGQDPFRAEKEGLSFLFGPEETDSAIETISKYYNDGALPNSPLLLNPIVHNEAGQPLGSGVIWGTALALGIHQLADESIERMKDLGAAYGLMHRGDNARAGLKIVAASSEICTAEAITKALYDLVNLDAPGYHPFYMLSGIKYLATHGLFRHPEFAELGELPTLNPQTILDAQQCWDAYDREHSLYMKWGRDPADIEQNNRFYNLCARDVMLFDATGPMRKAGGDETFEFLVPGLIPKGAITIIAASGGTGKSSIAHELCIHAASDYAPDETPPFWLGQPVNVAGTQDGVCVYFSGEDGPAIINARADLYDPEKRANRLQFHRSDFGGEDVSFAEFIEKRIMKMPKIPLIVIDPARKYLSGDEEDSEIVNEFFFALEELAMAKNAAVVVVHHLKRGAKPKSIPEVLDELRGSQVFIDRARVVLGMFREGKHTIVGLAKNNIPPTLGMLTEERVFVRNPKTLKLVWVPEESEKRNDAPSAEELERLEAESFMKQVEAAKAGGLVDDGAEYVPPSQR